jgi:AraC family transcriptional regulator
VRRSRDGALTPSTRRDGALYMHNTLSAAMTAAAMPEESRVPTCRSAWRTSAEESPPLAASHLVLSGETKNESALLIVLQLAVADLFQAVRAAIEDDRESATKCWHRAIAALGEKSAFGTPPPPELWSVYLQSPRLAKGGLAPWQIRRVRAYIESHLDATIHTEDLAALTRLTKSHFCRAFKRSCGESPHRYLMRRRVEHAQRLMLTTATPLGHIAVECGLADQAHFNRIFRKFVGQSPGNWRRARTTPPV